MSDDDPLTDLYSDEDPYDRSRLATKLGEFLEVDPESGGPVRHTGFESLAPREQAVALLLYRKVATELGEIDPGEEAVNAMWIDRNSDAVESDVYGFAADLDVIEETEQSTLLIPDHRVDAALDHLDGEH